MRRCMILFLLINVLHRSGGHKFITTQVLCNDGDVVQVDQTEENGTFFPLRTGEHVYGFGYYCAQNHIICGETTGTIACTAGRKIKVVKGFFGRKDSTPCRGSGVIRNCQRNNDATNKLAQQCDGKPSCEIGASRFIFGHACGADTSTYLEVSYICE